MIGIRVAIVRCASDDDWPSIVECQFRDSLGETHYFIEKSAIVTADEVDSKTKYPYPAVIACQIIGRSAFDAHGDSYLVDTEFPWHVSSTNEKTQFNVRVHDLIEWEFGKHNQRPWNGCA